MFFKICVITNFANIHRKTSALESLFNKVAVPKAAFTFIYILMVYILIYILICRINLYTKKQHVFLLRNDHLFSNQIEFDLKSINQEFYFKY